MKQEKRVYSLFILSISDMLFLSLFLYLSLSKGRHLLNDADTGYHIRAGEFILDTLSIPRHDMFSFLSPPLPWTAHEWLSEVIMALVHRAFGLTGVVIFFAFMISLIYYLFFRTIRTYKGSILLAVAIALLVIASSQIHWLARPHIFSLLLMVIWYYILDAYHYRGENYLWFLPPIMLLWVNLHGGFITGFILLGVYFMGSLVQCLAAEPEMKETPRRKYRFLALITFICLLASLVNPFGYHILLFPFNLVGDKYLMDHIYEFISPNFHEPLPFKYLLFLMIAVFAWSRQRLNIIELVLILLFINMALYSRRYIPLFSIIAAPIILRQGDLMLAETHNKFVDFLRRRAEGISSVDLSSRGYLWPTVGVLAVAVFAAGGTLNYKFDQKIKPVAAVEFLKREPIRGNMFNNDEFGDYIIYAAWPEYKVIFDGRSDMYGAERMKEYNNISGFEPGWEKLLEKYRISWIIFDAKSALSRFLLQDDRWRLIYADKVANIFVRNLPEYQYLITKYKDVKPLPPDDKGVKSE